MYHTCACLSVHFNATGIMSLSTREHYSGLYYDREKLGEISGNLSFFSSLLYLVSLVLKDLNQENMAEFFEVSENPSIYPGHNNPNKVSLYNIVPSPSLQKWMENWHMGLPTPAPSPNNSG